MWVFGYGSLMWDDWSEKLGCLNKKVGVLRGYQRTFNKASIKNWGTLKNPGPTLNLVETKHASCKGIVFEFPDEKRDAVMNDLKDREGKGFKFPELSIRICLSSTIKAIVPIYAGKNILINKKMPELVDMATKAIGDKGSCCDYVFNLERKMKSIRVYDPRVKEFADCLREKKLTVYPFT